MDRVTSAGAGTPQPGRELAALMGAAAARQRLGRFDEAARLFERAIELEPGEPAPWAALAACRLAARQPRAALEALAAGLRRIGPNPALFCAEARVLQSLGRVGEAAARLRQALALDATCGEARLGLALAALEAGDWDEAQRLAPPLAAGRTPPAPWAWVRARIALARGDFEAARRFAAAAAQAPQLGPEQRSETLLLLGEALDGLGRRSEAFAAFSQGKAALRRLYAARAQASESETARLARIAAWLRDADPGQWRAAAPDEDDGVRGHAFLFGFPRSGTTLLEQALAGHPHVVSLEEAPTLAQAQAKFLATDEGLERLARLTPAQAAAWRRRYWNEVARHGVDPAGRVFLDKAPASTLWLPLVARLFPRAKVLFALRDPRDVVLSCFRSSFQINAMTYAFTDLAETAACYGACMALARTCRAVLPLDLREARHEALVENFDVELGGIAAFLGLAPNPAMADVAATARRRVVRTPSAAQVRAGLNHNGLGRWRAYARELAPVMEALAPWIAAFGYDAGGYEAGGYKAGGYEARGGDG